MLAGVGLFSFNDALGKYLVATYSVGQLLLLRALVALVLLSPFIWRARAEFAAIPRPGLQLLRVVLSGGRGRGVLRRDGLSAAGRCDHLLHGGADLRHRAVGGRARRARRLAALDAVAVGFCGVLIALNPSAQTRELAGADRARRQSRLCGADGGDALPARHLRHGAGLEPVCARRCCSARRWRRSAG